MNASTCSVKGSNGDWHDVSMTLHLTHLVLFSGRSQVADDVGFHRQFFRNLSEVLPLLPTLLHLDLRLDNIQDSRTRYLSFDFEEHSLDPLIDVFLGPNSPPQLHTLVLARYQDCPFVPKEYDGEVETCPYHSNSFESDDLALTPDYKASLRPWHTAIFRLARAHTTLKRIWMMGITMGLAEIDLLEKCHRNDAMEGCRLMMVYDEWDRRNLGRLPFDKMWKHRLSFGMCARDVAIGRFDSHFDVLNRALIS
ncbi:hypothetical protein BC829DRAFT_260134 [Chytridium lagenaria]|nr:hypothetical protein BC829DRAFT_260134 [Chytridium lagenaria]